ncbi:MAG: hypothetical protein KGL39_35250 [Patescibacteria group bacterium]|nr:hypothetical protein [Patescibacteria group bacterium]
MADDFRCAMRHDVDCPVCGFRGHDGPKREERPAYRRRARHRLAQADRSDQAVATDTPEEASDG